MLRDSGQLAFFGAYFCRPIYSGAPPENQPLNSEPRYLLCLLFFSSSSCDNTWQMCVDVLSMDGNQLRRLCLLNIFFKISGVQCAARVIVREQQQRKAGF